MTSEPPGVLARALRVGTRGSRLALLQTELVAGLLRARLGDAALRIETCVIKTEGDRTQASGTPLQELPRGVFVKELEAALLNGSIDFAVHSLKDMTTDLTPGLVLAAVPAREDPRDTLVSRGRLTFAQLPPGARIGTSSPRRARQLTAVRPEVRVEPIRGNVDTRVRKVEQGEYDGAVLAAAGLNRLGLEGAISEYFGVEVCLPDAGQGALAVQAREGDPGLLSLLATVNDPGAWAEVTAERTLLRDLGGGCRVPIGALGRVDGDTLVLHGLVASADTPVILRASLSGSPGSPEALGHALALELRAMGADRLL